MGNPARLGRRLYLVLPGQLTPQYGVESAVSTLSVTACSVHDVEAVDLRSSTQLASTSSLAGIPQAQRRYFAKS